MITFRTPKHHWNYFLAIEKDLENVSRYIEFCENNLPTYSITLTHILLSASSEVDVIMKQLCSLVDKTTTTDNIDQYRSVIKKNLMSFIEEEISIERFGLNFKPWENWSNEINPKWCCSYNKVKHQRNNYFQEANLQNTLNAVGGLLISVIYYYKYAFSQEAGQEVIFKETTLQLEPESILMKMNPAYYYDQIVG
jgi:hypothetical protein